MANQAIALGVRIPQVDILGGSIQRNAQMMNMMAQQAAAQRQAEKAQQEMALAQQTADLTVEEKRRAFRKSDMEYLNNQLPGVKDDISWNRWLGELKKVDPGLSDDLLRRTGGRYIPEVVDIIGATAEQYINKNIATPVASFQVSDQGVPQSVTAGGLAPSSKEIPQYRYEPDQPAAGVPALSEGEAAPILKSAVESKTITPEDADRVRKSLGPNGGAQFDQWMTRNNIQVKPISFEQSGVEPLTMENAPQIVDAALKSGFIDPSHVEQLKQMVGPENGAAIDQWVQQSGLKVGGGMPGMRSAVYRPQAQEFGAPVADDGMSFGGPANALRQDVGYVPTTTRFKSPTQAPETAIPGSAKVPIPRVREEAKAQRKTPQEIYEERRMEKRAEADADFLENLPKARQSAKYMLNLVEQMIGDTTLEDGNIKVGKRPPKAGFEDVVGATWRPGARFIPGTNASDFDALLSQVQGQQFLQAYETLKGTGQITEIEGQKATDAMSRMKRSVSEKEFIKAAREFMGVVRAGLTRLDQREATLNGPAAAPTARRTPTKRGGAKELRYNPATGDFE